MTTKQPSTSDARHVLAVDDEPANLIVIRAMLEPAGYRLSYAENMDQARRTAQEEQPDLVLLDVMMPGGSGVELCRWWRSQADMSDVPIILVTALGADGHRRRGLEAGADDYIEKPIDMDGLLARVRSWTARGRATSNIPAAPAPDQVQRMLATASSFATGSDVLPLAIRMAEAAGMADTTARLRAGYPEENTR
jgi:DNA-binding response OmpR family regulator